MNRKNKLVIFLILIIGLVSAVVIFVEKDNGVKRFFSDTAVFAVAFTNEPWKIGAIAPSSKYLADEITKYVVLDGAPKRILEVGAGTGVFTLNLVKNLRPEDRLDVIENLPELVKILDKKFSHLPNVEVHCLSILDWYPKKKYDFIVSGLPFNAFDSGFLQEILDHYQMLIKNNGILSYFEYIVLPKIKRFFLDEQARKVFEDTLFCVKDFREGFSFEEKIVWPNLPPAKVHFLKISK